MNKDLFGLLELCFDAVKYLNNKILNNEYNEYLFLIDDFKKGINQVQKYLLRNVEENIDKPLAYCENIIFSIEEIIYSEFDIDLMKSKIRYEIIPFMLDLSNILEVFLTIKPYQEKWADYRMCLQNELFNRIKNFDYDEHKYQVSIVLVGYNKLEYTKKAVESIFKHTNFNKLNVELITINNGSTDDTRAYFETLPNEKKINLKNNILGTAAGEYVAEGKYIVLFSNDVIATHNWLENLLECIKSSDDIFWVVPTCNEEGISNNQGTKVSYSNSFESISEIELFAQKHNISNPRLWEECSILMPFVWIGKTNLIKGLSDKMYTQWEFIDDDWSTLIRRLGLKQILAKDTFMHHFGSVTLKESRTQDLSINNMREIYYKKWGIDAWESRGDVAGVEVLLEYDIYDKTKILFIEPKFGSNTLNIKNIFKNRGITISKTVGVVIDKRYLPDAQYMYDEILSEDNVYDILEKYCGKFNLISVSSFINDIEKNDVIKFLEFIYHKLDDKGQIIFTVKNYRNANVIFDLLTNNPHGVCGYEKIDFSGCDFNRLTKALLKSKYLNCFNVQAIVDHTKEVDMIFALDDSLNNLSNSQIEQFKNEIGTKYYTFVINKNC